MAAIAERLPVPGRREHGFFLGSAVVMAALVVAGFSHQLAVGRSSFGAPPLVHAHAIAFMGWIGIYVLQNAFVATGRTALHRRLGWIAAAWMAPMVVLGCAVTVAMVRRGGVPFFFRPQQFLVFDPMTVFTFAGLTVAAILLRRRTEWHRRLHFCAMSIMLGPGLSRLIPAPLFVPWSWETSTALCLAFPLVGMAADLRREGRVHTAWGWGFATLVVAVLATEAITYSPAGDALYRAVTAGSKGAAVAPLSFPPPPGPKPA
jgi:hypothetical protein